MIQAVTAITIKVLNYKCIDLYHDHCYHLYHGKISEMPSKYKHLVKNTNHKYILVYEE